MESQRSKVKIFNSFLLSIRNFYDFPENFFLFRNIVECDIKKVMKKVHVSDLESVNLHSAWKSNRMTNECNGNGSHLHTLISSLSSASSKERINRIWSDIRNYAISHPEEVSKKSIKDRRGRSSLHAICAKHPPLKVIESFLNLEECFALLKSKDNHGRTPLAISIAHNADSSVINLLLKTYPESSRIEDNTGSLPLHIACGNKCDSNIVEMLLRAAPNGAGVLAYDQRQTPLHIAIENSASFDVIKLLVDGTYIQKCVNFLLNWNMKYQFCFVNSWAFQLLTSIIYFCLLH